MVNSKAENLGGQESGSREGKRGAVVGTELSGGVVLQHADPDMAIGHWRKLYLLIWRDNTTVEGVDELRREFRE